MHIKQRLCIYLLISRANISGHTINIFFKISKLCVNLFKFKNIKNCMGLNKYLIMYEWYIKKPRELNNKFGFRKGVFVRLSFLKNQRV